MALLSKQSGASGTGSEHSVFFWARLKLTGVYVLILAIILVGFSLFLYKNISRSLSEADDNDFAGPDFHQHFVHNTLASVGQEIVLIDLVILIAAAGVSYFLAGYTLRPIQQALEAQQVFSEHASHELRTPLAVMKNDVEVLLRNHSPNKEQVQATLRGSVEEIDRLSRMVSDLLALARSQNHTLPIEDTADLSAVAADVAAKMRPLATNKNISVVVQGSMPLMAQGNVSALERVVTNLLQNAIEHTEAGGTVTVETRQENAFAVLTVADTGSGIDEKDLPHVFERFYKAEDEQGSGLGLSIVKGLVEQHGGSISIKSTKGEGTTATIKLSVAA